MNDDGCQKKNNKSPISLFLTAFQQIGSMLITLLSKESKYFFSNKYTIFFAGDRCLNFRYVEGGPSSCFFLYLIYIKTFTITLKEVDGV